MDTRTSITSYLLHNSHLSLYICLSLSGSVRLCLCLSFSVFLCLSVCLSACLPVCLSVSLSIPLTLYMSLLLLYNTSIYLHFCPLLPLQFSPTYIHLFLLFSFYLYLICHSLLLSFYSSVFLPFSILLYHLFNLPFSLLYSVFSFDPSHVVASLLRPSARHLPLSFRASLPPASVRPPVPFLQPTATPTYGITRLSDTTTTFPINHPITSSGEMRSQRTGRRILISAAPYPPRTPRKEG